MNSSIAAVEQSRELPRVLDRLRGVNDRLREAIARLENRLEPITLSREPKLAPVTPPNGLISARTQVAASLETIADEIRLAGDDVESLSDRIQV